MSSGHDDTTGTGTVRIGMIGYAFMGVAHSQGWRNAASYFSPPVRPDLAVIVGRDRAAATDVADRFGWGTVDTDWRRVVDSDDVDLIDVCTPGDTHAEVAIAALEAGKHVLCEKPLANSVAEAEAMAAVAEKAAASGVRSMVGFTYRRVPAIAYARELVARGALGRIHHVRAQYLQDFIADPEAPLMWRLQKERAGSGALGDIGAHIVDLTQFITGDRLAGVSGMLETFVKERPLPEGEQSAGVSSGNERGLVTVDDAALFLGRFAGGAVASFEATRFAVGRKNAIRIEINGSDGSLAFDFEDMNVLHVYDNTVDPHDAGFRRVVVTEPSHPYVAAWWPPGHGLGYEHGFTHQAVDLLTAIGEGREPAPSFSDGLQVQRVLAAVEDSAANASTWTEVPL